MKQIPSISIVIPAHNEEKNISNCLRSIFDQNYPKDRIEVIVVDDNSNDKTVAIAKKLGAKVIKIGSRKPGFAAEFAKIPGFKKASKDLVMYLDADIELIGKHWFRDMIKPLENPKITASFTRFLTKRGDNAFRRYMCFDPLQRDGLFQFLTPKLADVIIKETPQYALCKYTEGQIPPTGVCIYRRKELMPLIKDQKSFMELDILAQFVNQGRDLFAYVPKTGLYHLHAGSIKDLLEKRKRNIAGVYFLHSDRKLYTWINFQKWQDLIKIALWVIWANLFFPSLVSGIYKSLKHKDFAGLYEPIVNLLVTDLLVFNFVRIKWRSFFSFA